MFTALRRCVYANGGAGKKWCNAPSTFVHAARARARACVSVTIIVVPRLHRMGTAGHLIHRPFGPNPTDLCPLRIVTTNRDRLTKIRENARADGSLIEERASQQEELHCYASFESRSYLFSSSRRFISFLFFFIIQSHPLFRVFEGRDWSTKYLKYLKYWKRLMRIEIVWKIAIESGRIEIKFGKWRKRGGEREEKERGEIEIIKRIMFWLLGIISFS